MLVSVFSVFFINWFSVFATTWQNTTIQTKSKVQISLWLLLLLSFTPLKLFLWLLEDILFDYKQVALERPIFIVSGARTGSTFLHHTMSDSSNLVSFSLIELIAPSILIQRSIAALAKLDKCFDNRLKNAIVNCQNYLFPKDLVAKHSLRLDFTEENEFFFSIWSLTSVFSHHIHASTELVGDTFQDLAPAVRLALVQHFKQTLQRLMFARYGVHGAAQYRVLLKSHGIFRLPEIRQTFPSAQLITVIRHPLKSLASYMSLRRICLRTLSGVDALAHPQLLQRYMRYDRLYYETELAHLKAAGYTLFGKEHKLPLAASPWLVVPYTALVGQTAAVLSWLGRMLAVDFAPHQRPDRQNYKAAHISSPALEELVNSHFGAYLQEFSACICPT